MTLRARLFLYSLQRTKDLGWDDKISDTLCMEWRLICAQANNHGDFFVDSCLGSRSDEYILLGFSDATKYCLGLAIYLWNRTSNHISFILAKSCWKVFEWQIHSYFRTR